MCARVIVLSLSIARHLSHALRLSRPSHGWQGHRRAPTGRWCISGPAQNGVGGVRRAAGRRVLLNGRWAAAEETSARACPPPPPQPPASLDEHRASVQRASARNLYASRVRRSLLAGTRPASAGAALLGVNGMVGEQRKGSQEATVLTTLLGGSGWMEMGNAGHHKKKSTW